MLLEPALPFSGSLTNKSNKSLITFILYSLKREEGRGKGEYSEILSNRLSCLASTGFLAVFEYESFEREKSPSS